MEKMTHTAILPAPTDAESAEIRRVMRLILDAVDIDGDQLFFANSFYTREGAAHRLATYIVRGQP